MKGKEDNIFNIFCLLIVLVVGVAISPIVKEHVEVVPANPSCDAFCEVSNVK